MALHAPARMEPSEAQSFRSLLETQPVASLATLHHGEPAVSMVPFALLERGVGFVIHVSRLATHTRDMLSNPAVGLMVMASPDAADSPLALPRISVQGRARECDAESPEHEIAKGRYLSRLPQSEALFSFADFSIFLIEVRTVRYVAGFARAMSLTPDQFAAVMSASRS